MWRVMMNKITVGIESDAFDLIIQQTLVEDYRSLCDEVRRLENKFRKPYEQEDLNDSRRFRDGLEAILPYYLMSDKAQAIIDEEYIKNEYSDGVTNAEFIDPTNPMEHEVEYFKDLKEKRIQMLEEQVEYLMKAHHSHPPEPTFDGRKIQTDQWGKRYVFNENGIRTYLEPFDD
jgi:hypothetical protein